MATYPIEEGKILILGQEMSSGLKANQEIFPTPPVDTKKLDAALDAYVAARDAAAAAQVAAEQATATKQEVLHALSDDIKLNLRYAEAATNFDDLKLKLIGWGGRKERTPLTAPGRTRDLRLVERGEDWITLRWERPADGGKVAAYTILFRERDSDGNGEWNNEGTALITEGTLRGQAQGKELEYGVVAINKAGGRGDE
uniref:Fibronectin type-III domain-containing protein n=1 Tax=Candidatus Kentrum sp. MB TaxID=2138164 RepID=A0A451B9J5_9GAMM|nr:MAG: hypothetical protein BECKMB1821G_GA0114241_101134 [Candidatus Kentron sp. MB]VFK29850.1 MAG: hypothetical protein BECKMB1821I_GA0114274_101224 [Candidatus Kentron sp. MB]VFK74966.1 MAG: hypothetical protein BECKMB1821H_GA0114242_101324 [Candidatus Kentron sp. MB]